MSDVFDEFEFDEGDEKIESRQSKFTLFEGQPEIVSMAWIKGIDSDDFDPSDTASHGTSPKFIGCSTIFIKGVGKIIVPKDDAEVKKLVDEHAAPGDDTRLRVATVVIKWPVTRDGKKVSLDAEKVKAGKFEVFPWEFAPGKYNHFKDLGAENSLLECNLKVSLVKDKKPNYQDFTLINRPGSLLRKIFESKNEEFKKKIVSAIQDCIETLTDPKKSVLGKRMTAKEIRAKLNAEGGGGGGDSDTGDGAADDAEDIDDMLNDIE